MAWTDGIDRAVSYIVSATNWNDLLGAAGSLMQLKSHQHGGTTGEGSQSIGPLVQEDFTDAAAPAAPGAGKTRAYAVSGKLRFRAGAAGADTALIDGATTAAGDLAGTYPNPTVAKITLGADADGDIHYRAAGVLARLGIGTANQFLMVNGGGTAPQWTTSPFSTATAKLGADVTMTTTNTYYDGPSVSLAAGTWLVVGHVTIQSIADLAPVTAKLWDGTTVSASAQSNMGANGAVEITVSAIIVLGGTTTIKISATVGAGGGGDSIKAAAPTNGAGNNASIINAVKLA